MLNKTLYPPSGAPSLIRENDTSLFERKRVCVIGAGISGLVTVKELLEADQEVVCFEKTSGIGGVFGSSTERWQGYDSLLLTTSNYAMCFSSMPPENHEERHFWTAKRYYHYLSDFADHFNLKDYIKFNCEIIRVELTEKNKYLVAFKDNEGKKRRSVFDAIAVCSGVFTKERMPKLPLKADSNIRVKHTFDYYNNDAYYKQNVICIGMGESGADLASEVSKVAHSCTLLLKGSPPPVIPKYLSREFPNDAFTTQYVYRYYEAMRNSGLGKLFNMLYRFVGYEPVRHVRYNPADPRTNLLNEFYRLSAYDYDPLSRFLTKNEAALNQYLSGNLQIRFAQVKQIKGSTVTLDDGTDIKDVDTILCSTGYLPEYPFFKYDSKLKHLVSQSPRELYKNMFDPKIGKTLAFIGSARPAQGFFPAISELQARYFAQICSNAKHLPPESELITLTKKEGDAKRAMFHREQIQSLVQYPIYADELAKLIGCFPSKKWIFFDPILAFKLYYGSQVCNRYRLDGPGMQRKSAKEVVKRLAVAHDFYSIVSGIVLLPLLHLISAVRKIFKPTN